MKTFNRNPANIDTTGIKNYSKYFNQMNFKGISEDDNIYAIDQETFRDANNVYVNSDNKLVSRPTLQKDNLPSEIDVYEYELEDIKYIGENKVYINKSKIDNKSYFILLVDKDNKKHIIQNMVNYNFKLKFGTQCEVELTYNPIELTMTINNSTNCYVGTSGLTRQDLAIYSQISNEEWLLWYDYDYDKGELTLETYEGISWNNPLDTQVINLLLTKYHISTIEHYIICWNNQGAKVFDTSNSKAGWQDFSNFVEIPITKTITGSTETELTKNEFTTKYKEQYIQTNEISPLLPSGTPEIEIFTGSTETIKYEMSAANEYTDYKLHKAIKAPNFTGLYSVSAYNSTIQKYVLAVPDLDSVHISFNGGASYKTLAYPDYKGVPMSASLTEDGQHYCFVAEDGVYFLNLGDFSWSKDELSADINQSLGECFKTRQTYSFCVKLATRDDVSKEIVRLYFRGKSLYAGTDPTADDILSYIDEVYSGYPRELVKLNTLVSMSYNVILNNRINMFQTKNNLDEDIIIIALALTKTTKYDNLITIFGGKNMYDAAFSSPRENSGMLTQAEYFPNDANIAILDGQIATPKGDNWVYGFNYSITFDDTSYTDQYRWSTGTWTIKIYTVDVYDSDGRVTGYKPEFNSSASSRSLPLVPGDNRFYWSMEYHITPLKLEQGYIYYSKWSDKVYFMFNDSDKWIEFKEITNRIGQINQFTVTHDKYFIRAKDNETEDEWTLITNLFNDTDLVTFTYTYGEDTKYNKVPDVSYSDTELYLAFGDLLQITKNTRATDDVTKINFNLPSINNQSFIDNITAMINISTTEVAIFFLNKIVICSKVQDTNLAQGYRYDYYNTKFSIGVRLGDTVMNTLEGQYTIFPTKRGLAVMNYQAFMATTDQVVEYITDNIRELWNKFYESNNIIRIIQYNNKLIFTNSTNIILLYDLDRTAWWKWEVPIVIKSAVTDQLDLRLIDTNLNIFKDATQYYDFSEIGNFKEINWFLMSQPLHMSAPNYYKNLKQLVFQFAEGDDNIVTKTMNAQIKLYRKRLSIKEPETIKFQIENLRTFVKRFNYWKINEIQWALGNDTDTNVPKQFELNAISIKYEIGDEVR